MTSLVKQEAPLHKNKGGRENSEGHRNACEHNMRHYVVAMTQMLWVRG